MKLSAPHDEHTDEFVPNYWVRNLRESPLVEASDLDNALREAGLSRDDLKKGGDLIPMASEMRIIGVLTEQSADPLFALRLGQSTVVRQGSIVSYILHCSPNLHDGLANISKFSQLTRPRSVVQLIKLDSGAEFVIGHPDRAMQMASFYREFVLGSILKTLSAVTNADIRPLAVNLPLNAGNRNALLARALRCRIEGGQGHTGIVFGASDLERAIRTSDEHLLEHLTQYGQMLLKQRLPKEQTVTERVHGFISRRLNGQVPQISEAAGELAMSQRSLARRLAEEGTTYRVVVDDARFAVARALLADPSLSLTEISYILGYANPSAFTHAHRRWTGTSPTAFRQSAAHESVDQNK